MSRKFKIKRSRQFHGNSFRAGPHPVMVALGALVLAGLVYLGYLSFPPVYAFLTSERSASTAEPPEPIPEGEDAVSQPEPEAQAEPEPDPKPAASLRAAYMPVATALDSAAREAFLQGISGSGVNAVMVDIKNAAGEVLFRSTNPNAAEWGAISAQAYDLAALAQTLNSQGYRLVVRMSAFQDPIAASRGRVNAIYYRDTEWLWLDNAESAGGKPWLNPYAEGARAYLTDLAMEAVDAGASLVLLENVQFPMGSAANASFGAGVADISRARILKTFLEELSADAAAKGARAAVYIPALSITQEAENQTRYGGNPLDIAADTVVLGALPYQFSGSVNTGGLTIDQPEQNPAVTVAAVVNFAKTHYTGEPPSIIPLLQGGGESSSALPFSAEQVDAQIQAALGAGLEEYILYQTAGAYTLPASANKPAATA